MQLRLFKAKTLLNNAFKQQLWECFFFKPRTLNILQTSAGTLPAYNL